MKREQVVGIQPGIFRWARKTVGLSVADVAQMLKRPSEEIEAWESGDGAPTYPQLEKLAYQIYKRTLAVFFLPSPPEEVMPQREFRTLPVADLQTLSRDSDAHFWQHGTSTENDFIYVTTQSLNAEQLQVLSDEVGEGKSLLVCCSAFRGSADRFPNLTLKKIPKMVLQKCEWAHDDYSLNVENLPMAQPVALSPSPSPASGRGEKGASEGRKSRGAHAGQGGLFEEDEA